MPTQPPLSWSPVLFLGLFLLANGCTGELADEALSTTEHSDDGGLITPGPNDTNPAHDAHAPDASQPPDTGFDLDVGPTRDTNIDNEEDGGSDTEVDAETEPDVPVVTPNVPEVDPHCIDGQYAEALPDPGGDISNALASYSEDDLEAFIFGILDVRFPVGSWLVEGGLTHPSFDCINLFVTNRTSPTTVIRSLSTVVHECGHFYDFTLRQGSGSNGYGVTPELTIHCTGGDTTTRNGETFARSRIRHDQYQNLRPPCDGTFSHDCDRYADLYLNGDPDDAVFESGDQGFNMLLEETLQYVNSLATSYAFQDYIQGSTSAMDGLLTFLWYTTRYLRMARLEYPTAYEKLTTDACWRNAILTVWGRAWLMLGETEGINSLGIRDTELFEYVRDPELLYEIERLRQFAGCSAP